ncbi:MAG: hypothetical protein AABX37_03985 [Nanoarchaeota archaeon]
MFDFHIYLAILWIKGTKKRKKKKEKKDGAVDRLQQQAKSMFMGDARLSVDAIRNTYLN